MSGASSTFWSISGLTILGGLAAYAFYFDQKRRSDATFRRKLRLQKKKVAQLEEESKKNAGTSLGIPRDILLALYEKAKEEPIPSTIDERHAFFTQAVALAEQLSAMGPGSAIDAGLYFFQALRAYPNPSELASIYQKTLPEPILSVVMELHTIDLSSSFEGAGKTAGPSINLDSTEPSPTSNGPPSETSSQDWDKLTDPGSSGLAT